MDDPEDAGKKGKRKDGKDLTQAWLQRYGNSGAYVWNEKQFSELKPENVDHLLGLFERSHMEYEFDREKDAGGEPSLAEMTRKAIDILARNPQGFFLMVEGGRIDHAHHEGNAFRALSDAVAFNDAIKAALEKVSTDDTLIVVTADHSHAFTINGYPKRDNPLMGIVVGVDGKATLGEDGKPYTTLSYANGPGGSKEPKERADADHGAGHGPGLHPAGAGADGERDPRRRGCRHLRRSAPGRICSRRRCRSPTSSTSWTTPPRSASGRWPRPPASRSRRRTPTEHTDRPPPLPGCGGQSPRRACEWPDAQ